MLFGIDGRYATALYTAAAKKSALQTVESDLTALQSTIGKSTAIQIGLENPMINRADKLQLVTELSKGKSPITGNLLNVLVENGRLGETTKVIEGFQSLMMAHRGELSVTVTSATALDGATLNKIKTMLDKSVVGGNVKSLKVENKVKPAILGGLVVEFGDKTIDLSTSAKVAKYSKLLNDLI